MQAPSPIPATVSDDPNPAHLALARAFAALVALVRERPQAVSEQRDAARAVADAARAGAVTFVLVDGTVRANDDALDDAAFAARLDAHGVEELGITGRAAQADLLELARLLAAEPAAGDPAARFGARAAVLDRAALPRRMRARPEPVVGSVDAPVAPDDGTSAPRAPTPAAERAVTPPPSRAVTPPPMRSVTPSMALPVVAPIPEPVSAEPLLDSALPMPTPSHHTLAAAIDALDLVDGPAAFSRAIDALVTVCDLAFRQGRDDDLIEGLTALVAAESAALAADPSDERRQTLNHALRRLARPVLLRQLAVLRHRRAGDAEARARVQQALARFGRDGAEALLDEYAAAPTTEARAACLEGLRGLRRTWDALHHHVRDQREHVVRQAAATLGALRDSRGEALLIELLQHPEAPVRRAAVRALAASEQEVALEATGFALNDESPLVRLAAVASLATRRTPRAQALLAPLLDREPDREVLFAAIAALGQPGAADAVPLLVRVAQGEGPHPQRRTAALRIQACLALITVRTPTAMAAVQQLRDDRDRDVREASVRLVAQAARRTTTGAMPVVPG